MPRHKNSIISPTTGELMHMLDLKFHEYPLNCAHNIDLRSGQAKFKREQNEVQKQNALLDKNCENAKRRIDTEKAKILSLIGLDSLPSESFYHQMLGASVKTPPGFCYRHDGKARRPNSLTESKTRRIVHDMDGKLGFFSKTAANVVSDNPIMTEVLSSPEIIAILCDIRTTAAILENKDMVKQFATKFEYLETMDPNSVLPLRKLHDNIVAMMEAEPANEKQDVEQAKLRPVDYLKLYRKNLLHEFFELFQEKAEIRLSSGISRNTALRFLWATPVKSVTRLDADQRIVDRSKPPISVGEWNEALMSRLEDVEQGVFPKAVPQSINLTGSSMQVSELNKGSKTGSVDTDRPRVRFGRGQASSRRSLVFSGFGNLSIQSQPRSTSRKSPIQARRTPRSRVGSSKPSTRPGTANTVKENDTRSEPTGRQAFNEFMKDLLTDIELLDTAERAYIDIKHKNPGHSHAMRHTGLKAVLKRPSLFSTLENDDLIFYQFDGGKQQVTDLLTKELRKGGRKLKLAMAQEDDENTMHQSTPTYCSSSTAEASSFTSKTSESSRKLRQNTASNELTARTTKSASFAMPEPSQVSTSTRNSAKSASTANSSKRNEIGTPKKLTLNRLFCQACKAKIRQGCLVSRERDIKDQLQIKAGLWKMSGRSDEWTKQATTNEIASDKLLLAIPATNYGETLTKFSNSSATPPPKSQLRKAIESFKRAPKLNSSGQERLVLNPLTDEMKTIKSIEQALSTPMFPGSNFPAKLPLLQRTRTRGSSAGFGRRVSFATSSALTEAQSTSNILEKRRLRKLINPNSWTLKVSTLDVMRLRNEVELEKLAKKLQMADQL